MSAFEVFLLLIVGLSVLVSLILQSIDSSQKDERKAYLDGEQSAQQVSDSGGCESGGDVDSSDGQQHQEAGSYARVLDTEETEVRESGIPVVVGSSDLCSVSGYLENDWEGIERTELEKTFGKAVVFVNSHSNADQIGGVKQQLGWLQRVVLQGPCQESRPTFLNVSALSNWNAWQMPGSVTREAAMETYIGILSKAVPEWSAIL